MCGIPKLLLVADCSDWSVSLLRCGLCGVWTGEGSIPSEEVKTLHLLTTANYNASSSVSCFTGMSCSRSWDQYLFHIVSDDLRINKYLWLAPAGLWCLFHFQLTRSQQPVWPAHGHQGAPFTCLQLINTRSRSWRIWTGSSLSVLYIFSFGEVWFYQ